MKRIYKTGEKPEVGDLIIWEGILLLVEKIENRRRDFLLNYILSPDVIKLWYYLPYVAPQCQLVKRNSNEWLSWL